MRCNRIALQLYCIALRCRGIALHCNRIAVQTYCIALDWHCSAIALRRNRILTSGWCSNTVLIQE
eukprot:969287-Pyramimonas_sp.AAC.1